MSRCYQRQGQFSRCATPQIGQPRQGLARRGCRLALLFQNSAEGSCKPNSVVCGHSSRRRVAADTHQRPTRRFRQWLEPPGRIGPMRNASLALGSRFPPYLVLLRVGFTLPRLLQAERCALTAPFHPYPGTEPASWLRVAFVPKEKVSRGGFFSVALAVYAPLRAHPG